MKYIRECGAMAQPYKADYNTNNYTVEELENICDEWNDEEPSGATPFFVDED